jgi:acyl-CoA synthetase (AMP-forming)/AMP-acid ligase II
MSGLATLIHRAARQFRDDIAVVDGERRWTFQEVDRRSNRLANALGALSGTAPGRVGLLLPNCVEAVEADFALIKARKTKVPINTRLADGEREYVLLNSGAETLVFDEQFASWVEAAAERLPDLKHLIAVGDAAAGAHAYEDLLARADDRPPRLELDPFGASFILYTSGTTGRPTGATATNRSRLAATVSMWIDELDVRAGDGMVHVGSMAHGSGSKTLAYFLRGARNIPVAKFEADRFLDLVGRERATGTFVVPTMIAMLVEAMGERGDGVPETLRTVSYGGAPITPTALTEALATFGGVFVQVYGSCEAPHPVMVLSKLDHRVSLDTAHRLGSVGRETTLVEVKLAGSDGEEVPVGEPGEMWVRGPNVMTGYWGNDEATEAVLHDGWYRTGDVARRDEDGFFYIVDRARDMVITGGLNVYPAEVEAAVASHPSVAEVAVIGVPDARWGESVKALVVLRREAHATAEELLEHCRPLLAGYKKPKSFDFVDSLPKGSTGKVLKRELRAPFWKGEARAVN